MDRVAKVAQHVGGGDASFVSELTALSELFRDGMLTDAEFAQAKTKLLRRPALPGCTSGGAAPAPQAALAGTVTPGGAAAAVEDNGAVQMTDQERFLYDLQGFLHVPGHVRDHPLPHPLPRLPGSQRCLRLHPSQLPQTAQAIGLLPMLLIPGLIVTDCLCFQLTQEEVAQLNQAFDDNWDKRHQGVGGRQNEFTGMLEWPKPYSQPFRDLLAHPKSLPYLNTQFGQGWRMDHSPFLITGTAGPDGENPAKGGGIHGSTNASPGGAAYYQWQNSSMVCDV